MQILSISIEGTRDLPKCIISDISGSTQFRGPTPQSSAIADAISFWFASLQSQDLSNLLVQWGWSNAEQIEVVGEDYPEQVFWNGALFPSIWVSDDKNFSVTLRIALDANQVGKIRSSTQDPTILLALMECPEFRMTISGLFTNDYQGMAISKSDIFIGEYEVPLERPYWLKRVLAGFRGGFFRNYEQFSVADQILKCALSITDYHLYVSFQDACKLYGDLRVTKSDDEAPILLLDDRPVTRWGWSIIQKLRSLAALHLFSADIVWIDDWMGEAAEGVQVFSTSPTGDTLININNPKQPLQFPRSE
jgi:hypothetical protein